MHVALKGPHTIPAAASWYAEDTVHSAPFAHWEVALQLLPRGMRPEGTEVEVEIGKIDIMSVAVEEAVLAGTQDLAR